MATERQQQIIREIQETATEASTRSAPPDDCFCGASRGDCEHTAPQPGGKR